MNTLELRTEILRRAEREKDTSTLEAVLNFLRSPPDEQRWWDALTKRALKAEEDIKAGRGKDIDDLERELDKEFDA